MQKISGYGHCNPPQTQHLLRQRANMVISPNSKAKVSRPLPNIRCRNTEEWTYRGNIVRTVCIDRDAMGGVRSITILFDDERIRKTHSRRTKWAARVLERFMDLPSDAYRFEIQQNGEESSEWWSLRRCLMKSDKRIRRKSQKGNPRVGCDSKVWNEAERKRKSDFAPRRVSRRRRTR